MDLGLLPGLSLPAGATLREPARHPLAQVAGHLADSLAQHPADPHADDPEKRAVGKRWQDFIARRVRWKTVCQ